MEQKNKQLTANESKMDLTSVITAAIKMPGVKVNRELFLREQFKDLQREQIELIIEKGPVDAGCKRQELRKKASRIIKERAAVSTGASFLAGLPGGFAMVATIPADMLQFYGVALRMAQELVYLYGESDLWCDGTPDTDKITNQLVLYCGVMLGASGAAQTVRVMSSALAKQALKKLPRMALSKHLYYTVVKSILKFFGVSLTKTSFAKGVSKVIPVVGGVVSGGITLMSIMPMGKRLVETLDKAHFTYSKADFELDMQDIWDVANQEQNTDCETNDDEECSVHSIDKQDEVLSKIEKAKKMFDDGIISEQEFLEIKAKLISKL